MQVSAAFEMNLRGYAATVALGWGFIYGPWKANLFSLIRQQQPSAHRYGLIILGLFLTLQIVNMNELSRLMQQRVQASALAKRLRNGGAVVNSPDHARTP